ncbi:MAG: PHP domain-containing protein [Dehalococcoidales bacterium]
MLKADFHIHTEYSMDCNTSLDKIIKRCGEVGVNCITVSDHGVIEGALEMQKRAPFKVIVAEEILTTQGEIIGMFLKEVIPSELPVSETIARIREQGGLVCIPHPFDLIRTSALKDKVIEEIAGEIDIIEVFNARNPLPHSSAKARAFAEKHGMAMSAGSDAHTPNEIGNAWVEMPEFSGSDDFLEALRAGEITGRRTNVLNHFYSTWARVKNFRI